MLIILFAINSSCKKEIENHSLNPIVDFKNIKAWQQKNEPEAYSAFREDFKEIFNSDTIVNLSKMFSHHFNRKEKTIDFLSMIKVSNGKITNSQFKYFDKKKQRTNKIDLAVYNLKMEKGNWFDMRIKLDSLNKIERLIITDANYNEELPLIKNKSKMQLPFKNEEEWFVLWGGDTEEDNYHVISKSQKNAIDFLIKHPYSKKTYKSEGSRNDDYYAFNEKIMSPCKGEVVRVVNGIKDNTPGNMNRKQLTGNTIIIKTEKDEYVLLAHLKNNSIQVNEGDKIKVGQLLALCGNSGNSSEPHLHLQMMNDIDMKEGIGIKIYFDNVIINNISRAKNYSPRRGDLVMNK